MKMQQWYCPKAACDLDSCATVLDSSCLGACRSSCFWWRLCSQGIGWKSGCASNLTYSSRLRPMLRLPRLSCQARDMYIIHRWDTHGTCASDTYRP
jgi:hypothetical protein